MQITTKKEKNTVVIMVEGRLDAVTSPDFDKELTGLIGQGETLFVLDLGRLDYISSAGLRSVLAATKRLKEKQGRLSLAGLKDVVKEVFEISGFSAIIPIYESVDLALSKI